MPNTNIKSWPEVYAELDENRISTVARVPYGALEIVGTITETPEKVLCWMEVKNGTYFISQEIREYGSGDAVLAYENIRYRVEGLANEEKRE
jgi:hypothetical protein